MVELRLLGVLELRGEGGAPLSAVLAQPKRLALLAYLALAPGLSFRRRDTVAALLWPEQDQEHARGSLRQALRFLRRELGETAIRNRGEEEIGLDGTLVHCDVVAFEAALRGNDPEAAARLYGGILLEGFFVGDAAPEFDQWLDNERNRLRGLAGEAFWAAAERSSTRGELAAAIAFGRQAVQQRPDDEAGLRRLLSLFDSDGDRAGAIAAYEQFAARLRAEYDAEPAAETRRLIEAIRARSHPHRESAPDSPPTPTRASGPGRAGEPVDSARRPRALLVAMVLLAAGILSIAGYRLLASRSPRHELPALTLAVLPIRDLTPDTAQATLAEAATDELITDLAQIGALRVINRRTMMQYRDSTGPTDRIAERLGANALILGTLQRSGDSVALRAQLVMAGDTRIVWAGTYAGDRSELFAWLQQVAREVAGRVRVELTASERASLASRRSVDPEAFELYAKGRWWWNKRGRANLAKADDYFHQALAIQPTYALAWSGLADTYAQLGYGGYLAPEEAFSKAKAMARGALDLDSTLAEPHAALGYALMYFDWDWDAAEREFQQAIRRNPSYATAHEWYGLFLAAMGRFTDAEREGRLAQELDPLSAAVAATRGWILHYAGKEAEALRVLRAGARTDSTNGIVQLYLGRVHQAMGAYDSATAHYFATGALRSWIPTIAGEGTVAAREGRLSEARRVIQQLDSLSRQGEYVTPYAVALVFAALGERDSAFARLEQGFRERTHWLVWLNRDSRWQTLRGDRRFGDLARRIGLPP